MKRVNLSQRIKEKYSKTYLSVLIIIPLILFIIPKDYFNSGKTVCLSVAIFDLECWGCGITRAIMHLIHFDIEAAWDFNKLSFIILPIICYLWFKETRHIYLCILMKKRT
jgi:hypothetical protein